MYWLKKVPGVDSGTFFFLTLQTLQEEGDKYRYKHITVYKQKPPCGYTMGVLMTRPSFFFAY